MRPVYSDHETQLARELIINKSSDAECRERLGRSRKALLVHLRWRDNPKYRESKELARQERKGDQSRGVPRIYTSIGSRPQPTAEQLRAASDRTCAPRTITASVFGDPAPGQSALDRRNTAEMSV